MNTEPRFTAVPITSADSSALAIEQNDYVSYVKHSDMVRAMGAGYVSQVTENHAVIDGKIHLYAGRGDTMSLVAKQQRLPETPESHSPATWGTKWGSGYSG